MRLIALALAFALLAAFSFDAGAARLGGGRSAGRQSSQVTQREAARQQPAAPGQQQAAQQPRRQWGGLLGGLAAGLGLAWLANALGLGEGFANVLLIALLVMAGMAVLRMRRGSAAQAAGGPAWPAANSYNPAKVGNDASARPWERAATTAGGSMIGSALSGPQGWGIPAGFDIAGFTEAARRNFISLQAAWDKGDEAALRAMMTDEMLAETRARLAERGGQPSQTVVNMLQAQLLGIEELPAEYMASVEFSGLITEDGNGPSPFREAWNMTKPKTGPGGWLVAGIQPLS
ncbi:Tim44 domain-containing protein [Ottowia massiliensis]|uniref:Tim44 domain-containing protein n=1 Tax=Ottowia massiliensis TaxID=2045302 RepID=UPI000C84D210|nr:TIM44-like domain-containing protein [Ottowia massiliensis]